MGFPAISATSQATTSPGARTSHVLTLPSGIVAGNLLIMVFCEEAVPDPAVTWPAGWTQISDSFTTTNKFQIRYRIADGSEGASITVTSPSWQSAYVCYRITAWHGTTPPEVGTAVTNSSGTANPPSLTPSWGAADTLWIAAASVVGSGIGGFTGYPASYGLSNLAVTSDNVRIGVAGRQLNAASDDPGTFTQGVITWWAQTVAVRPVAGGGPRSQGMIIN